MDTVVSRNLNFTCAFESSLHLDLLLRLSSKHNISFEEQSDLSNGQSERFSLPKNIRTHAVYTEVRVHTHAHSQSSLRRPGEHPTHYALEK